MEIVTSWMEKGIERGIEQGIERGIKQGEQTLINRQLKRRFNISEELENRINNLSINQIESFLAEKSIEISIDYTDFSNFIHFSSAYQRLLNFY